MSSSLAVFAQTADIVPSTFWRMVVNGVSLGAIYAVLAMGFVIIFKSTQVFNLATGAIAALGAFLVSSAATIVNIPGRWIEGAPTWLQWGLSVVFAVLVTAALAMLMERLFLRPMVGEALILLAVVTLGADILIRTITNDFIGLSARPMADPFGISQLGIGCATDGFVPSVDLVDVCSVRIPHTTIFQVLLSSLLVGAVALFFRSKTGVAMRATAFDQEAARAQGISVARIFALSFAIGAVLAAVGGMFISMFPRRPGGVDNLTAFFAFRAFPAVILGGLDSVFGALVGGLVIGMAESAASSYVTFSFLGTGFGGVVPYVVMLLVLLVRPYGLFGTEEIRRV